MCFRLPAQSLHRIFCLLFLCCLLVLYCVPVSAVEPEGSESDVETPSVSEDQVPADDPVDEVPPVETPADGEEIEPSVSEPPAEVPLEGEGSGPIDSPSPESLELSETAPSVVGEMTVQAETVVLGLPEENDYPTDSPLAGGLYIECNTAELGEVLIYIPVDYQYKSFTFDETGNIVNIRSSTISGLLYRGSSTYTFRISSFSNPTYRSYNSGSSYSDLTVTSVLNTNVVFVEGNEDIPVVPDSDMQGLICIFLLGVIVLCLFMRRW